MADLWRTTRNALAVTMLFGSVVVGDDAPADPRRADLDRLITQLANDDWKSRQGAEEGLVELGEDALPRLSKLADGSDDAEVRTRAAAAAARIEDDRLVGKSVVTVNLHDVPAAEALAELARQGRAALPTDPPNLLSPKRPKLVSLSFDHRPFWEVMQSFCAQTELEVTGITRHNREIGLGLTKGDAAWMDKPIVLSGPLLIRADRLTRISTARLKPPRDVVQEFTIGLTVFAEPKLKVLDYSGTLRLEDVVDEKGNSLIPPEDNGAPANVDVFGNAREGATSRWDVGATLHHPKGAGARIARFRATTAVQVQVRAGALELPLAGARGVSRTVGGVRVSVKALDANRCDLTVHRDGRGNAEWENVRMQLYAGEAQLTDDKGQVLARSQSGLDADEAPDGQRMEIRIRFAREASDEGSKDARKRSVSEATKFSFQFPLEIRQLVVPFEFRDLPIP